MVANDSIDTGFALNTIHAVAEWRPGRSPNSVSRYQQEGRQVQRASEGLPAMDAHTSAVGCGAE
jgi:hypothetical protein